MKTSIAATLALAAALTPALAEQRYDRRLEAAAIRIVAAKMGDLRGGFGLDERPVFVAPIGVAPSPPVSLLSSTGAVGSTGSGNAGPGEYRSF